MLLFERSYMVMLETALRRMLQNMANGRNAKDRPTASEYTLGNV